MAEHGIIKENVYNFDKIRFIIGVIVSGIIVISTEQYAKLRQA